ncbi:MAG: phosphoribosylamine--glycine ligase [Elusimicrobia bacterium]|nr:phosphoribosylamine--glycine ligase [Elusimicrobiota bacterium]
MRIGGAPGKRVLLVGSGGREHALAWKLHQSPRLARLFAAPGSAAIAEFAQCLPGDPTRPDEILSLCREFDITCVVIGPEAPLAAGLSDALSAAGIPTFGPGRDAARLESSKSFAKSFMRRTGIATARCESFDHPARAQDAAARLEFPVVIKADGLAAGKGVRICHTRREAMETIQDFMVARRLGEAGRRVLFEERLTGLETTVMAFCDGKNLRVLPPSRDHKRLQDSGRGPNTGGMGAFAPAFIPTDIWNRIETDILQRTLRGLQEEKIDYRGILYWGLMLTPEGPKVLEFNVRLGDPEAQAVLPLLRTDLLDLVEATVEGSLDRTPLELRTGYCVTIVLASEGYPFEPRTGRAITGLSALAELPGTAAFHAGTARTPEGAWVTAGGRVLDIAATGETLEQARSAAYDAAGKVSFPGMQFRTDIASTAIQPPPTPAREQARPAGSNR